MSQEPKVTRFGASPLIDSELATKKYVDDSGGGGGSGKTFAVLVKPVEQIVNNSDVLQDDDDLTFTPTINNEYVIMLYLRFNSGNVPDLKFAFSVPAGATVVAASAGATLFRNLTQVTQTTDFTAAKTVVTNTVPQTVGIMAFLQMGATAGDCTIQWAQNTAAVEDTKMLAGALMVVWENGA